MKNIKKKKYFVIQILIGTLVFSLILLSVSLYNTILLQEYYDESASNYIDITDTYDVDKNNIFDFFKQENSLEIMRNVYNRLIEDKNLYYFEFMEQTVEYIGDYTGKDENVYGGNESKNQNINGEIITPLKSIQLSKYVFNELDIGNMIDVESDSFSNEDYFFDKLDRVNILVGSEYKRMFELGREIVVYYLGSKITLIVKGFFVNNASLNFGKEKYNLDEYIIVPSLNAINFDENDMFQKILYSEKCTCYLYYSEESEYEYSINQLDNIQKDTSFKLSYIKSPKNIFENNKIELSQKNTLLFLKISMILFLVGIIICFFCECNFCKSSNTFSIKYYLMLNVFKVVIIEIISFSFLYCLIFNTMIRYGFEDALFIIIAIGISYFLVASILEAIVLLYYYNVKKSMNNN
jgi:putative ABC transport system permease protein